MNHWVYVERGAGNWIAIRGFNYENAAWLFVEKQESNARMVGAKVEHYKVMYGQYEDTRPETIRQKA